MKYKTSKIHFFKNQNSTLGLRVKWEVCEKGTFLSLSGRRNGRCIKNKVRIICASPSISPDNREYTVVPTILLESPKWPSDEKCLGPTNPLIRPFLQYG
jgi:hypothetical protein